MILFSIIYYNYSLENIFFLPCLSVSFKSLLENNIIKKHHIKYKNCDYINQLIRLSAELLLNQLAK